MPAPPELIQRFYDAQYQAFRQQLWADELRCRIRKYYVRGGKPYVKITHDLQLLTDQAHKTAKQVHEAKGYNHD